MANEFIARNGVIALGGSIISGSLISGVTADSSSLLITPYARAIPQPYVSLGTASLGFRFSGSVDDFSYEILLPFSASFFDKKYSSVWVSSNGILSFVTGSTLFSGLKANIPPLPQIQTQVMDGSLQRLYTGSEAGNTFRIRFEGYNTTNAGLNASNKIYNYIFYSGSNQIDLVIDSMAAIPSTTPNIIFAVATGSLPYYQNIDINIFPSASGTIISQSYAITTFTGSIDDFKIYNKILTVTEIDALFNNVAN
jgi:hypothetical protein